MESLVAPPTSRRPQYGPAGRGGIKVPAGGEWTNVGPYRSDWIQNGLRVTESDTGRVRNFLVHPTNADIVYVLKSSGGLWKTTNFSDPRPAWRAMSDTVLSTSGGSAAFGKNPETIYLASGDPFDPGVGGFIYRSTNGGNDWSAGIKLGISTRIPDVKVDTTGATDVVLAGTNAGMFRSADGGNSYSQVISNAFVVWSLQQTSAGWIAALQSGANGLLVRSTDAGATWSVLATAAMFTRAADASLWVRRPGRRGRLCLCGNDQQRPQKDLYRSSDGGLTWTRSGSAIM